VRESLLEGGGMVEVTRLDGKTYYVNPHQIEYIERNPDTTLTMLSGKKLVVREDYQTVFSRIIEYRKLIGAFKNEE
jgi:flagellar protein FlbD